MESFIKEYRYENGDIQKVQVVNLDSWSDLKFMRPEYSKEGFTKLCDLYENFIIKKFAAIFGKIVLFTVPENMEVPFESDTPYGKVLSPLSKANIALRKNSYVKGGKILFKDKMTEDFFNELKEKGCLRIAEGKRNSVTFSPVGNCFGFLSENHKESPFKVNSSFFIMDQFDLGSVYDEISVPLGLAVQDGVILNPPQFGREVLAVDRNDNIRITDIGLKDIGVVIDGVTYEHKKNAVFFERPEKRKTDRGGFDIAVVNNRVAALKKGGQTEIPSGGFVLKLENE
ncbi:MAG: hypothetical protein MJ171_03490, partial [Clostridia bacterium]|nr:hypothetical protein [Clostridia bacterium]